MSKCLGSHDNDHGYKSIFQYIIYRELKAQNFQTHHTFQILHTFQLKQHPHYLITTLIHINGI